MLNRLLTPNYTFKDSEMVLAFRYKMIIIISLILSFFSMFFAVMQHLGIHPMGETMRNIQVGISMSALLCFFIIKNYKKSYLFVMYTLIILSFSLFAISFFIVEHNSYRAAWFSILILGVFVLHTIYLGLIVAFMTIVFITVSVHYFGVQMNTVSFSALINSIIITTTILFFYARRVHQYEHELLEKNRILDKLATYDSLTGVMNRRTFLDISQKYFSKSQRKKSHFYFLMIDIDNFKLINDSFGHFAGDQVLINAAHSISSFIRAHDIIGRLGGEEFGIAIIEDSPDQAKKVAEKVRQAVQEHGFSYKENKIDVTISIGLASSKNHDNLEETMIHADKAMYKAKESGKNCIKCEEDA